MKYITISFTPGGRQYTYECDDPTVQPGDEVQVSGPSGATLTRTVIEVSGNRPPFACKPAMKVS